MHAPFIYTSLNDAIDLPSLNDASSIYKSLNNAQTNSTFSKMLHRFTLLSTRLQLFTYLSIMLYRFIQHRFVKKIRDVDPCNFSLLPIRLFVWMNPDPKKSQDETEIPFC